jgi:transposase
MTYSTDFRRKVLAVKKQEKLTDEATAKRFGIGIANLSRWKKNLEANRTRNKPATKINMEALKLDVEMYPDAYQYERAARFGVSERGIGKALKRLNISYKKNTETPQGER